MTNDNSMATPRTMNAKEKKRLKDKKKKFIKKVLKSLENDDDVTDKEA